MDYTIRKVKRGYIMEQLFLDSDGKMKPYRRPIDHEDMHYILGLISPKVEICLGRYLEIQKTWLLGLLGQICLGDSKGITFDTRAGYTTDELYRSLFQGGVFRDLMWQHYWRPLKVLEYQKIITQTRYKVIVDVRRFKAKYMVSTKRGTSSKY